MCVDMEGTLLTVEETVELAPAPTPTPRRRSPRSRASAKPDTEISGDSGAVPEAVQAPENTPDVSTAQAEVLQAELTPESSRETIVTAEPEAVRPADPASIPEVQVPEVQDVDSAAVAPAVAATVWEAPAIDRPAERTGDGRADLNNRNRSRDSRGRRDRGPRPAPGERSNGAERFAGDGRDGRQPGYGQPRQRNGAPYATQP